METGFELFDELSTGIIVRETDTGDLIYVNDSIEELYGYSFAQLREMDIGEFTADDTQHAQ